ncbi:MAG: hypothetical protein KBD16_02035 [Candidatus Pacebacteria bacterium]|nr:hypothetical protein [Candidatus Paceibacterota bacterium]
MHNFLFSTLLAFSIVVLPTAVSAAQDSIGINLDVAFCNHDLVCDAEENYAACPSDCAAPATTTPPSEDDDDESPSGTRASVFESMIEILSPFIPFFEVAEPTEESVQCDGASCTRTLSRVRDNSTSATFNEEKNNGFRIATPEDDNAVVFLWDRGSSVRILRSTEQFPQEAFEGGTLIYEGSSGFFEDSLDSIAENLYYALFVRTDSGGYAAPQLVLVKNSLLASPLGATGTMSNGSAFGFAILGTLITILIVRIIWFLL